MPDNPEINHKAAQFACRALTGNGRQLCSSPSQVQGFITAEEVLSIPELSINPMAKRLAYMFDSINFKEFLVRRQGHHPFAAAACHPATVPWPRPWSFG
jgi:hypothetical protein